MSRLWRFVLVSCLPSLATLATLAVALAVPARAEQPSVTPPSSTAPAPAAPATPPPAAPAAPAVTAPAPAPAPPATSEYPPVTTYPAPAPVIQTGTAAPGATLAMPALQPQPRPQYQHYGLAVMLADLTWIWASWRLENGPLALGGYVGAAPLAHALMGNPRSAWISAGLRAGALAFTTGVTLYALSSSCYDCETEMELVVLGLIGAGTIMVADWLVLARKEIPRQAIEPRPQRDAPRWHEVPKSDKPPDWAVQPDVQATQGGLQLGVSGWF
jgi:hypothetical protein